MLRTMVLATMAAVAVLFTGYRVVCVPPPVELALEANEPTWWPEGAPPWYLSPMPVGETSSDDVVPVEPFVSELLRAPDRASVDDRNKSRLLAFYKMPVLDAPVEIDPDMVVTPDNPEKYPMPVIVPEGRALREMPSIRPGPGHTIVLRPGPDEAPSPREPEAEP